VRIAFAHNLQTVSSEEQAEFDTAETVAAISHALTSLGHEVLPLDVGQPVVDVVTQLLRWQPDLVFNTAEGHSGRSREAFWPHLFEQLGIPCTGSDAYVCTTTLDKHLTKRIVEEAGVPVAVGALLIDVDDQLPTGLTYPAFVKPNFEGSSKGITSASIVADEQALRAQVGRLLARYPSGVLVEPYLPGRDVVVPYVEGVGDNGVLEAAGYAFGGKHADAAIYDYDMKNGDDADVSVVAPAPIPEALRAELQTLSDRAFRRLGVRDLARIDWRIDTEGRPWFLEINALPSLQPGAGIYASAALAGLATPADVLERVLASACARHGLPTTKRSVAPALTQTRVGLIYNLKRTAPSVDGAEDAEAEFDAPQTVEAIERALQSLGHEVVRIEADAHVLRRLETTPIDVAFNIAEGLRGRSREALVPAVLDLLGIEHTGSDAATLCVTLDKGLAKRVVAQAGVPTAPWFVMHSSRDAVPASLAYPRLVKPVAEGSSKGVSARAVVHDETELRDQVRALVKRYAQPVLVEAFLPGREFTLGVLGGRKPRVLPPMEIVFAPEAGESPIYGFEQKQTSAHVRFDVPATVSRGLSRELVRVTRDAYLALGCRDVARIDVRLDEAGVPNFIECNPLPGLTPDFSDLCVIASAAGLSYTQLIGAILAPALARAGRMAPEVAS
jgi:D-alanine-D-alanine ligase